MQKNETSFYSIRKWAQWITPPPRAPQKERKKAREKKSGEKFQCYVVEMVKQQWKEEKKPPSMSKIKKQEEEEDVNVGWSYSWMSAHFTSHQLGKSWKKT